jgi:hypothetical protein
MWRELTITLPYNWMYMATVVVRTEIFCVGATWTQGEWAARVLMKFCPSTMEVFRMSMVREHRKYISIAVHTGFIYANGGNNHTQRLSSMETSATTSGPW